MPPPLLIFLQQKKKIKPLLAYYWWQYSLPLVIHSNVVALESEPMKKCITH
jgi:hypothetical protein